MSGEDDFLSRWSRRKLTPEAPAPEPAPEPPAPVEEDARPDGEILAELGLPDPASLKPGDDVTGFLREAVPERLRRVALRALWRSNPALANLDGLIEYGEDYTDKATVVEKLATVYRVGEGMVRKVKAEDAEAEAPPPEDAPEAEAAPEPEPDSEPAPEQIAEVAPEEAAPVDPTPEEEQVADAAPTRRRMTFAYD